MPCDVAALSLTERDRRESRVGGCFGVEKVGELADALGEARCRLVRNEGSILAAVTTGLPTTSGGQRHSSEMPTSESINPSCAMISVALGNREQILMPVDSSPPRRRLDRSPTPPSESRCRSCSFAVKCLGPTTAMAFSAAGVDANLGWYPLSSDPDSLLVLTIADRDCRRP